MDAEQLLDTFLRAIQNIGTVYEGVYVLYAQGNRLHFCRLSELSRNKNVIGFIHSFNLNTNFGPLKRKILISKIEELQKKGFL